MHFFRTTAYTGLYVIFIVRKGTPVMDECVIAIETIPVSTENTGDVDDLIFLNCPDWFASER